MFVHGIQQLYQNTVLNVRFEEHHLAFLLVRPLSQLDRGNTRSDERPKVLAVKNPISVRRREDVKECTARSRGDCMEPASRHTSVVGDSRVTLERYNVMHASSVSRY